MAKLTIADEAKNLDMKIMGAQMFEAVRSTKQTGDKFYVPTKDNLLVVSGYVVVGEGDTARELHTAQRFPVAHIDDSGKLIEVVDLYVGQVCKIDAHGRVVFPGKLASALRSSGEAFADLICGKVLTITDEVEIDDRIWNNIDQRWEREDPEDLTSPYKTRRARAYKFEPQNAPKSLDVESLENAIIEYDVKTYPDFVKTE